MKRYEKRLDLDRTAEAGIAVMTLDRVHPGV